MQTLAANMSGELHVRLETDTVTATTYFKDLQNNQFQDTSTTSQDDQQQSQDVTTLYEARVEVRKLSQFLQGQFNPTKVICSKWDLVRQGSKVFRSHSTYATKGQLIWNIAITTYHFPAIEFP